MITAKRQWIFSLFVFVFLLTSLAVTDASQAALLQSDANTPFQATSYGSPGRGLQAYTTQTADKIENGLLTAIEENGSADFIVRFTTQADLSAAYSMDWNARGEFVYNTLRDTATKSQVNAKAILDAGGLKYQTFIAGNELYVWSGTLMNANGLAALPEVYVIRVTRTYSIDPIAEIKPLQNISWAGDFLANNAITTVGNSTTAVTDWGITDTKADQFWTRFGVKGDGMVVANIDTGVQWEHPALINQFKCPGDPSNPACWNDPSNICAGGTACDNNGHGTHTMGTMVGKDDPTLAYIVGMAPNAKWIACKGCETDSCSAFALNTCADWILAPGDSPANRPNVVNNSWGAGVGGDAWYQTKVVAWRAAGIFPAFAAGNRNFFIFCNILDSPGDYQESFGSAAHDSSRAIAYFSSTGPSAFGDTPYTKPNISAPGVSICSTVPPNSWDCSYSGTSMASPHSAGAVALLWSCNPALVGQIDTTFQLLQNNTDTAPASYCGAPADGQGNYSFGYGYLNVLKAGVAGCAPTAVKLVDFRATSTHQAIQLDWQTAQEMDLLGFNLFRAEALDGPQVKINSQLIPGISPGQLRGNDYQYMDVTAEAGKSYYYWVEWVGTNSSEQYGPVIGSFSPYRVWLPLGVK